MNNQNSFFRNIDNKLWGASPSQPGKIGNMDSYSRATVHKGWHSINCGVTAVKETITGKWDYKGTKSEAARVVYHNNQQKKGLSPLRKK